MSDNMLRVSSWQIIILATITFLSSNVCAPPSPSASPRTSSSQKTYAFDYRDIPDFIWPQVLHSSLGADARNRKFTPTEKSVSESTTDVPDLKEKPHHIEPPVLPMDPRNILAAQSAHSPPSFEGTAIKAATNQHQNISKDVERDLLHRPLGGLPELIDQAEHSLDHLSDNLDSKRLNELSKVMAAWEAHQRKVNEALEEGTRITTTTASPSFPFLGASRRVIGRSWRKITNRLFPESLKKMLTIFPGTIWCGAGDKANNDTERLGSQNETDACCRDHDLSKDYIAAGQMAPEYGNIQNKYTFSMSTCESDERFRECLLRNVRNGSDSSEAVGYLYFTIIKPKCFTQILNNCTKTKERCSRSSDDFEWTIRENLDFPDPDPRNRLLDAVLVALSAIRYFFPRGLAESWSQLSVVG